MDTCPPPSLTRTLVDSLAYWSCITLIVYINPQAAPFSLYIRLSLKMTAKSKIFAKDSVKKLAFMLAPLKQIT